MVAGLMQLGYDLSYRLTHARDFLQAIVRNQVLQGLCEGQEVLRRARVGLGTVRVATAQGRALPKFVKQLGNFGCSKDGSWQLSDNAQDGHWCRRRS